MADKIEVGVIIKGADAATNQINKVDSSTKALSGNINMATSSLDKMTGGAISAFRGIASGVKTGIAGMKGFKIALASTGIGLLVVAMGSLVAFFTKTQRGAEMLEIATASLGVIFDKLVDVASSMGETLMGVFTNPMEAIKGIGGAIETFVMDKVSKLMTGLGLLGSAFKKLFERDFSGAMADGAAGVLKLNQALNPMVIVGELVVETVTNIAGGVKEMVGEITEAVSAVDLLANRSIQLRKDQRDLALGFAEGRAQIKEYNLIAEDVTQTLEDRLVAAQKAIDIEKTLMSERQRLAQEEVDIQKGNMALTESTEADKQKLVDLEVALINIRTESAEMQTTLGNKLNIINAQAAAEKAAEMQAFLDDLDAQGKAEEDAKLKRLSDLKILRDAEKATAQAVRTARLGIVSAGFDALKSMAKTEEGQKKLAIAQILVNQGIALSNAIAGAQASALGTGPGAVFTAPGFTASLVGMVLSSFASIKGIMNQAGAATSGLETSIPTGGGGGGGAGAQLALTPTLESFGEGTLQLPAVQAFILQNDIADAGALQAELQAQSSL